MEAAAQTNLTMHKHGKRSGPRRPGGEAKSAVFF